MRGDAFPSEAIAADAAEVLDPPIEPAQAVELRPASILAYLAAPRLSGTRRSILSTP